MTTQYVYIKTSGVGYSPDPPVVKPGYEVIFEMDGRTDEVTVDFGTETPFVNQDVTFQLNGAITAQASKAHYIAESADGNYHFTVVPGIKIDPEPPGTLSGDLDVERDSPPEDEKKKKPLK